MSKQSPEEIRREVLREDAKKDINIYLAVPICMVSGISALGALTAVISLRALLYFRLGIDAYWLSCVPFLFPAITGLFSAYKKQLGLLGVHLTVTLLAMLMGGFGYALSVEPVFLNRNHCTPVTKGVLCEKESLAFLYLVSGGVAAGFAALGALLTICGLYSATKRIAKRREEEEVLHIQEQNEKQKEQRRMASQHNTKASTLTATAHPAQHNGQHGTAPHNEPQPSAPNGVAQTTPAPVSKPDDTKVADDVTTRL